MTTVGFSVVAATAQASVDDIDEGDRNTYVGRTMMMMEEGSECWSLIAVISGLLWMLLVIDRSDNL